MRLRDNSIEIALVLQNSEKLWRLLHYKPLNAFDDPLDPNKPDVLTLDNFYDDILPAHLLFTPKSDDLDSNIATRICFFPSNRYPSNGKANQEFNFDVFVHSDINDKDMRLTWILDTIHELMFNKRITGIGKVTERPSGNLPAPTGYMGYRLSFNIGSGN